jgi:hypothetical protein
MRRLPDGVPRTRLKIKTQPLKEKNKMKHTSFKTIFQPWVLVALILVLQTVTLFTAETEAA